jgi:uncharacterized protein (TIGR01777 family)
MRVVLTGASGLIGSRLGAALSSRGDEVVALGRQSGWDPASGPAPAELLAGADAVVHLAGENIAQRWSAAVKERISTSRTIGTANLVAGIAAAEPRPRALLCANAVGYYGNRGDELLSEQSPVGEDWLAGVCAAWQEAAMRAGEVGARVCVLRTGVVLDRHGGALAKMLPPFQSGVGGPVAGGRQFMSWIHLDDLVALYIAAIDDDRYAGPLNAVAPEAVRNSDFSRALGHALHRPAFAPVPALALRMLFGEMAQIVTDSQNVAPRRLGELGFAYAHPELDAALADALSR